MCLVIHEKKKVHTLTFISHTRDLWVIYDSLVGVETQRRPSPNDAHEPLGMGANAPPDDKRVSIFAGHRRLELGLPRRGLRAWRQPEHRCASAVKKVERKRSSCRGGGVGPGTGSRWWGVRGGEGDERPQTTEVRVSNGRRARPTHVLSLSVL